MKTKLDQLVGKTISHVSSKPTWDKKETETLQIEFTDGSILEVGAQTEAGCPECDEDGSQITYLFILRYSRKPNGSTEVIE